MAACKSGQTATAKVIVCPGPFVPLRRPPCLSAPTDTSCSPSIFPSLLLQPRRARTATAPAPTAEWLQLREPRASLARSSHPPPARQRPSGQIAGRPARSGPKIDAGQRLRLAGGALGRALGGPRTVGNNGGSCHFDAIPRLAAASSFAAKRGTVAGIALTVGGIRKKGSLIGSHA